MEYEAFLDALRAAARVDTDEICEFDTERWGECENEAVWLVEYEAKKGPKGLLVCDRCSRRGWMHCRDNELHFHPVHPDLKSELEDRIDRFVPIEEYADDDELEVYERRYADAEPYPYGDREAEA